MTTDTDTRAIEIFKVFNDIFAHLAPSPSQLAFEQDAAALEDADRARQDALAMAAMDADLECCHVCGDPTEETSPGSDVKTCLPCLIRLVEERTGRKLV